MGDVIPLSPSILRPSHYSHAIEEFEFDGQDWVQRQEVYKNRVEYRDFATALTELDKFKAGKVGKYDPNRIHLDDEPTLWRGHKFYDLVPSSRENPTPKLLVMGNSTKHNRFRVVGFIANCSELITPGDFVVMDRVYDGSPLYGADVVRGDKLVLNYRAMKLAQFISTLTDIQQTNVVQLHL